MSNVVLNTRFSTNWNNKLYAEYFTTLRLYNMKKYYPGAVHDIWLKNMQLGRAIVIDHKNLTIDQVNDWIGYLDTGYHAKKTQDILHKMYKKMKQPVHLSWAMFHWQERYLVPTFETNDLITPKEQVA